MITRRHFHLAVTLLLIKASKARAFEKHKKLWYCPAALTPNRSVRTDYISSLSNAQNWIDIAPQVKVLKFYIESMTPSASHLADVDLAKLVKVCLDHNFKAGFEVGGVRMSQSSYGPGVGREYAAKECQILDRWVAQGGSVDYITLDNPVMNIVSLLNREQPQIKKKYDPDTNELIAEMAESIAVFQHNFPNAKIGLTESLGFFDIDGSHDMRIQNLDPNNLPPINLEDFISSSLKALSKVQSRLDHFHIDCGYEAVWADGGHKKLSFDRVAAANVLFKRHGIPTGLMVGAFDRYTIAHETSDDDDQASESAIVNTKEYFETFLASRIQVNQILLDRWERYPDRTGPVTDMITDMGLTAALIKIYNSNR